jgi:hypothetical protein
MIPTDKPAFLDCFHQVGYLYADRDAYVVGYLTSVNPDHYTYSDNELAAADPRLPKVVAKLCRQYKHSSVPLSSIFNTIDFWKNPVFLKGANGETYAIRKFKEVKNIDRETGLVQLVVESYHHFRAGSCPYVTYQEELTLTFSSEELEKRYPGWFVRYDVLGVLATDDAEMLQSLFQQAPKVRKSVKVAMTDLTFD